MKKILYIIILLIILLIIGYTAILLYNGGKEKTTDNIKQPTDKDIEPVIKENITKETYLNEITYKEKLDKDIENVIIEYMDEYYKTIHTLEERDLTYLFSNEEQANINQTALSLLVESRLLKENDLSLTDAYYDLEILSVDKKGNKIVVMVEEDSYVNFAFMSDIQSKSFNIANLFTLEQINGEYKIAEYLKIQDFFIMITNVYEDNNKDLEKIKNNYLTIIKENILKLEDEYASYLAGTGHTPLICDNEYNREKATAYSYKWIQDRNSKWYTSPDSNCQNYASQVLYAGGIPMDIKGNYLEQWKFYSPADEQWVIIKLETRNGISYSWINVGKFREYVDSNKGYGLCAKSDVNLYYGEPGDIIQVGYLGPYRHTVVVSDVYEKDGKVIDILVNSNTIDLENYPMSAYSYPYHSLIKIYGWNN